MHVGIQRYAAQKQSRRSQGERFYFAQPNTVVKCSPTTSRASNRINQGCLLPLSPPLGRLE